MDYWLDSGPHLYANDNYLYQSESIKGIRFLLRKDTFADFFLRTKHTPF